MNKGIKLAKGEWLYFMGSDDRLYNPNVLHHLEMYFNKNIDLILGKVVYKIQEYYPFIYNQKKTVKTPSWNWKILIRNAVHHQGTFFRKALFQTEKYNLNYKILADYHFNLTLFKAKTTFTITDICIAECSSSGISKTGKWLIYKEETSLKTNLSSLLFWPFFYVLSFTKYCIAWSTKRKPS